MPPRESDPVTNPISRENRDRGLRKLIRKSHPEYPYNQWRYEYERFKRDDTETRYIKVANWKISPAYSGIQRPATEVRTIREGIPPTEKMEVPPREMTEVERLRMENEQLTRRNAELEEKLAYLMQRVIALETRR